MKSNKLMFLVILVLCFSSLFFVTYGFSAEYSWKIGIVDPPDYHMTQLTQEWVDMIEKRTNGMIKSNVFPSGQLGGDIDMLEGVQMGSLQVWEGGALVLSAFDPLCDVWALPYIFNNKAHEYRFWDKYGKRVFDLIAEKTNYRIVAVIDGPNRQLTTTKPVRKIEDLKGLKIRVPEVAPFIKTWNAFEAGAIAMPFTEVYTALQTGVIDGQENDMVLSYNSGFFDVAKYLVMTNHVAYEGFILFNEEYFQSLPKDIQNIIHEVSKEISLKSREIVAKQEKETLEKIKSKNIEIIQIDLEPFKERAKVVYKNYPEAKSILDLIKSVE